MQILCNDTKTLDQCFQYYFKFFTRPLSQVYLFDFKYKLKRPKHLIYLSFFVCVICISSFVRGFWFWFSGFSVYFFQPTFLHETKMGKVHKNCHRARKSCHRGCHISFSNKMLYLTMHCNCTIAIRFSAFIIMYMYKDLL